MATAFNIDPREVVRRAAEGTKNPTGKDWLWKDERGTWEQDARALLETPGLEEKARTAGLGRDDVIEEASVILRLRALETVRRSMNPDGPTESELTRRLKF